MINKINYTIEEMPDLTTNIEDHPVATKFRNEIIRYSGNNILLDNNMLIYIELTREQKIAINEYNMDIFTTFLRSEKMIVECNNIINEYNLTARNNSTTYSKNCYDVIINMDQVYKKIWNICKLLNDDVVSYKNYLKWQKVNIRIDDSIYKEWDKIYDIRNVIEHPSKPLSPTILKKDKYGKIEKPFIIWKEEKIDLLELAVKSIQISYIFAKLLIEASFLYSKYTKTVIDRNMFYQSTDGN